MFTTPPPLYVPAKKKFGCLKVLVVLVGLFAAFIIFIAYAAHQGGKMREKELAEKAAAEAAERQRLEKQADEAASRFPEVKAQVLDDLAHAAQAGDESTVAFISDKYRSVTDHEYKTALKDANDRLIPIREQKRAAQLAEQRRIDEVAAQKRRDEYAQRAAAEKAKAEAEVAALPKVSAAKLHKEYDQNEVTADAKWKGKIVIVSGEIHSIEKDFMDDAYVTLSWDKYGFQTVRCDFGKDMEALKSLKKGDLVQIKGQVNGFLMRDVMIKNCALPPKAGVGESKGN